MAYETSKNEDISYVEAHDKVVKEINERQYDLAETQLYVFD